MPYRKLARPSRRSALALLGLGAGLCAGQLLPISRAIAGEGATAPNTSVLERIEGSDEVMEAIKQRLKPGTVLVTTDQPATPDTRTDKNMVVIDEPAK
jgi:hypothetical protein